MIYNLENVYSLIIFECSLFACIILYDNFVQCEKESVAHANSDIALYNVFLFDEEDFIISISVTFEKKIYDITKR